MSDAIPERSISGHHADLLSVNVHGIYPKTREFFIGGTSLPGGGWGAKHNEDGVSATVCINDGDTHNSPNEQTEAKFPIIVESYSLIPDSGGAGKFRGGLGVERTSRARATLTVNSQIDRVHCKPWGLKGGLEGGGNALTTRVNGKWRDDYANAKMIFELKNDGDAFQVRSGGGGGYGHPYERAIESVRNDVRQGYVTVKAAEELYGVVIDAKTFVIDEKATENKRADLRNNSHA